MNSKIVELRDWIDLTFSLQVSNTWATWLVISSSFDSMFVTQEDKVVKPYKIKKHIKSYMLHILKTSNKNTAPLIQLKKRRFQGYKDLMTIFPRVCSDSRPAAASSVTEGLRIFFSYTPHPRRILFNKANPKQLRQKKNT